MCGIVGFWAPQGDVSELRGREWLMQMGAAIVHRGPDDEGRWCDVAAGIGLGHRRLSVLDLSPAGHQPMVSECGRFVLVFNGELYNHLELRRELESTLPSAHPPLRVGEGGMDWRGRSDTETLLAGFSRWGIRETLIRTVGMFALGVWDRETRNLTLVRDRLGEKPLYFGWQKGVLLFGSELKALKAHPAFIGEIDRDALTLFLRHNAIPAPYSIYRGVRKLQPGTILTIRPGERNELSESYWCAFDVATRGQREPFTGSEQDAVDDLERRLREAIAGQMVADVPLGAFLSGGVDSSTVVALMQAQSPRPVKTFSIGFFEAGYNEAEHAKAVAQHLGTDHTELYVTPQEAQMVIPALPGLYDEPFSDSSQIPTILVAQLARQHVTVSLSGDGGDELFGGYDRYFLTRSLWNKLGRMPPSARKVIAGMIRLLTAENWTRLAGSTTWMAGGSLRHRPVGDRAYKLAEILLADAPEVLYRQMVSHWKQPEQIAIGGRELPTVLTDEVRWPDLADFEHRMMYLDLVSYLPDDILVKVDRAGMGVSLETRMPLLDHRVVEFAWRLPLAMKIHDGQGKWLLRQVLYRYVPRKLIERPKMGFGVPIDTWLRGPLRDWCEELLDESRLRQEGFFNPEPIRRKWREHLTGERSWEYYLWDVLMFQAWLDRNRAGNEQRGGHGG